MPRRARSVSRVAGLTLIECLVVVAVLAVIMAILLPAVTQARSDAIVRGCQNKQKTIASVMTTYLADNDNILPNARNNAPPILSQHEGLPLSVMLLGRSINRNQAMRCPGDEGLLYYQTGMSYLYNSHVGGMSIDDIVDEVRTPRKTRIVWDAHNSTYDTADGPLTIPAFHEGTNVMFLDWHVETLP